MSDIAETYIVVSLLMAVFAAVATIGTALVLGIGFERLRGGFEVIRKQTAFFSDAIRKLEEKSDNLDQRTVSLEQQTVILDHRTSSLEEQHNELVRTLKEEGHNHLHAEKPAPRADNPAPSAPAEKEDDVSGEVIALAQKVRERHARIMERAQMTSNDDFVVPASMMHHVFAMGDQVQFH